MSIRCRCCSILHMLNFSSQMFDRKKVWQHTNRNILKTHLLMPAGNHSEEKNNTKSFILLYAVIGRERKRLLRSTDGGAQGGRATPDHPFYTQSLTSPKRNRSLSLSSALFRIPFSSHSYLLRGWITRAAGYTLREPFGAGGPKEKTSLLFSILTFLPAGWGGWPCGPWTPGQVKKQQKSRKGPGASCSGR